MATQFEGRLRANQFRDPLVASKLEEERNKALLREVESRRYQSADLTLILITSLAVIATLTFLITTLSPEPVVKTEVDSNGTTGELIRGDQVNLILDGDGTPHLVPQTVPGLSPTDEPSLQLIPTSPIQFEELPTDEIRNLTFVSNSLGRES